MKNLLIILGVIVLGFVTFLSRSQQAKYYKDGSLLVERTITNDSSYIKGLPSTCTLTNLTKQDLRLFKNLLIQEQIGTDKSLDNGIKVILDKIIVDLNTKNTDTSRVFRINNLPTAYLRDYGKSGVYAYCNFVNYRRDARQFLRIAANVQRIDTAFYLLGNSSMPCELDKTILKRDLRLGL